MSDDFFKNWPPEKIADWRIENMKGAFSFAETATKLLVLVNGGAVIGILTFYGNVLSRTDAAINKCAITGALLSFGIGVFLAIVCAGLAYVSQYYTAFVDSSRFEALFRIVAILSGFLSALAFLAGTCLAIGSFA